MLIRVRCGRGLSSFLFMLFAVMVTLSAFSCSSEIVEVPVEKVVEKEVLKVVEREVPVEVIEKCR